MDFAPIQPDAPQINYHPDTHVIGVRFEKLGKLYHFDFTGFMDIQPQDYVLVATSRGQHIGQVIGFAEREDDERDYKPVLRMASGRDMLMMEQWKQRQVETIIDCRELAAEMGGFENVKFVAAEYNFDGSYLTIMYSTEDDVEINPLRLEIEEQTGVNTEFRRLGPREVARRLGGQGACGGPRCCSTFLTEFSPISIKMAKAQGIPLNPNEITGMCGRLRCCLIYEYEQYVEARKQLPKRNKMIGTPHGEARVADVHPLKDGVSVYIEKQRHFVSREEIIPLDEFRALQEKAAAGCSKNESGSCDCGSHRPKSASGDLQAAIELAHGSPNAMPETEETQADSVEKEKKKRSSKSRSRRSRNRRNKSQSGDQQSSDSSSNSGEDNKKQSKSSRNRRNRNKRRGRFKRGQNKNKKD